jgi:hypothetical protein
MGDADFNDLKSDKALVAYRQVHSSAGGATIPCVVLSDGFIIECGFDGYSVQRAKSIANAINSYGAGVFSRDGLAKAKARGE